MDVLKINDDDDDDDVQWCTSINDNVANKLLGAKINK